MLKFIRPSITKVAKDLAFIKSLQEARIPHLNCGVKFMPFEYFMKPQKVRRILPKSGHALFPKPMSPENWANAAKECEKYQQKLLEKFNFNTEDSENENSRSDQS